MLSSTALLRSGLPIPAALRLDFHATSNKKPTEDCLSPRKTTTIISVFSHKWWKRRGIKAPPFFFWGCIGRREQVFSKYRKRKKPIIQRFYMVKYPKNPAFTAKNTPPPRQIWAKVRRVHATGISSHVACIIMTLSRKKIKLS